MIPVALPRLGSTTDRLAHIIADSQPSVVFCLRAHRAAITAALGDRDSHDVAVVALDEPDPIVLRGAPLDRSPEAAVIQYTSGSTRLPKGVLLTADQIVANAAEVRRGALQLGPGDITVNWLPHFHDMGLMGGILYPLLNGGRSVQLDPLDVVRQPVEWLRAISTYRATFSGAPTFAYADCLRRVTDAACEGLDLSSWTTAICGAEPIPADLPREFHRRFAAYGLPAGAFSGCYGMAEMSVFAAGGRISVDPPPPPPSGCAGVHPCPLDNAAPTRLRIVDPDRLTAMDDGLQGEIWIAGPSKAAGYLNLPDETEAMFHARIKGGGDGTEWLRTGDLGVIQNGFLYVNGRIKDTLVANGRKIAAAELEWLAANINGALNPLAAAAFTPDITSGARAVLLIELKPGHAEPEQPDAIRDSIRRRVFGEWGIELIEIRILPRGSLDRTSSGKIRRQNIANDYRAGRAPVENQTRMRSLP